MILVVRVIKNADIELFEPHTSVQNERVARRWSFVSKNVAMILKSWHQGLPAASSRSRVKGLEVRWGHIPLKRRVGLSQGNQITRVRKGRNCTLLEFLVIRHRHWRSIPALAEQVSGASSQRCPKRHRWRWWATVLPRKDSKVESAAPLAPSLAPSPYIIRCRPKKIMPYISVYIYINRWLIREVIWYTWKLFWICIYYIYMHIYVMHIFLRTADANCSVCYHVFAHWGSARSRAENRKFYEIQMKTRKCRSNRWQSFQSLVELMKLEWFLYSFCNFWGYINFIC